MLFLISIRSAFKVLHSRHCLIACSVKQHDNGRKAAPHLAQGMQRCTLWVKYLCWTLAALFIQFRSSGCYKYVVSLQRGSSPSTLRPSQIPHNPLPSFHFKQHLHRLLQFFLNFELWKPHLNQTISAERFLVYGNLEI